MICKHYLVAFNSLLEVEHLLKYVFVATCILDNVMTKRKFTFLRTYMYMYHFAWADQKKSRNTSEILP